VRGRHPLPRRAIVNHLFGDIGIFASTSIMGSLDAIEDLRVREGPTRKERIGSFREPFERGRHFHALRAWASNRGFDDIVWTDLPPDFGAAPFSVEAAVTYVERLDARGRTLAREYLKNAPDFVQTPVRRALQGFVEQGD
jgi:hypothetical protein